MRNRRLWAGLALGGALAAAGALVCNRASHDSAANARASEPVPSKPIEAPAPARKLDTAAAPPESSSAPPGGFARYEEYFNRNYYATYSYASPAYAPANWGRGTPAAPPSAFTLPSIADLLEPAKLLPNAPLAVPLTAAVPDVSRLTPATVSMPAPSSPVGLLTNNTPFHLFVTSDPVSAASSTASGALSLESSGAGGGAVGAVTGTAGSVTGSAGSLLHK